MGTNYYLYTGKTHKVVCEECGHVHRCQDKIHIGKSSFGRYFTLHSAYVDGVILDSLSKWSDYVSKFKKAKIKDEYGEEISWSDMKDIITRVNYKEREADYKIGEPANQYGDVYGEKGLIYTRGRLLGEDGLYVIFAGDFS